MRGIDRVLASILLAGAVGGAAAFARQSGSASTAGLVQLSTPPPEHVGDASTIVIAPPLERKGTPAPLAAGKPRVARGPQVAVFAVPQPSIASIRRAAPALPQAVGPQPSTPPPPPASTPAAPQAAPPPAPTPAAPVTPSPPAAAPPPPAQAVAAPAPPAPEPPRALATVPVPPAPAPAPTPAPTPAPGTVPGTVPGTAPGTVPGTVPGDKADGHDQYEPGSGPKDHGGGGPLPVPPMAGAVSDAAVAPPASPAASQTGAGEGDGHSKHGSTAGS